MKRDNAATPLLCATCNAPLVSMGDDVSSTLVGYVRGACGGPHNDNCLTRSAWCRAGHQTVIALRRTCEGCDWRGKESCDCHQGRKLDAWPALPVGLPPTVVEAKSAVMPALVVACPTCLAVVGEPCKRPDGQYVTFKGHLGVHLGRMPGPIVARPRSKDAT